MQKEDIFYFLVLVFSIPLGHLVKSCGSNCGMKKLIVCMTGIILVITLCGTDILHTLIVIIGTFLIVKLNGGKNCRWMSFGYVFGYLFVMRTLAFYRFWEYGKYTNVVQLIVTLRMVSLPFEIEKGKTAENEKKNNNTIDASNLKAVPENISLYDFLSYGYCYIGLMTGPFYTYKTFNDMLLTDHRKTTTVLPALKNLKILPVFLICYLILSRKFPISYMESDTYLNHPWGLVHHLLVLVPMFITFRWRFYIAWLLAESACMNAGLGAYPVQCEAKSGGGPTKIISTLDEEDTAYGFQTIKNVNIREIELAPTMTIAMRDWNTTVQWWLSTYVYRELPIKSKPIRMSILLFVSAFWHGVHPGYYLTFLSVPFVVLAEKRMLAAVTPFLDERGEYLLSWITHFCLYRSFEYLGVGFILLHWGTTLRVWLKMYFIGHIFILVFILLPLIIPKKKDLKDD